MFPRRRGEINTLIARAYRLDLYERLDLESYIAGGILDYIMHAKAKNIEDLVENVRAVCDTASYLGRVCAVCYVIEKVYDEAEDYGLNLKEYRTAVRSIFQVLDVLFQNAEERYISVVGEAAPRDSTVLLVSYSSRMAKLVTALSYKFSRVLVPVRDPMRTGMQIAETLKKRGVNVAYIPDHSLAWAVQESDVVLADAIGISGGERVTVDAGVAPAVAMAKERNSKPLIVLPLQASCSRRLAEEATLPYIRVESSLGGPKVNLALIDFLDPQKYSFELVTENTVLEGSRTVIRERMRVVSEIIDDTIQSTLDSMI